MPLPLKKAWYPARPPENGWGWGLPLRWQGWVAFVIYLVLLNGCAVLMPLLGVVGSFLAAVGVTASFIGVLYATGENPNRPPGSR